MSTSVAQKAELGAESPLRRKCARGSDSDGIRKRDGCALYKTVQVSPRPTLYLLHSLISDLGLPGRLADLILKLALA